MKKELGRIADGIDKLIRILCEINDLEYSDYEG